MRLLFASLMVPASLASLLAQTPQPAAEPTVVLEGQVVDLRGEPVPKATLQVVDQQESDRVLARTMCDGEGFFISRVPERDIWMVRAESPGHCPGAAWAFADQLAAVRIAVHDAATVRGVLKNEQGMPVPGAVVRAEPVARILWGTRVDAVTDAGGRFTLAGVPLGRVCLSAVVPGEGFAESRFLLQDDEEAPFRTLGWPKTTLQVAIEGVPADSNDAIRVEIRMRGPQGQIRFPPPWERPLVGKDGRLELAGIPDLECEVIPLAAGLVFAPPVLTVPRTLGPRAVKFTAARLGDPGLRCPALVLQDGRPAAGIRLAMRSRGRTAEATSGADGTLSFAAPAMPRTTVRILSLDDRFVLDQAGAFAADAQGPECKVDPQALLRLSLIPACSVHGRVLLADGCAAAFVPVSLENYVANRGPQWLAFAATKTDRQGNYRFPRRHCVADPVRVDVESWCGSGTSEVLGLQQPGTELTVPDLALSVPAIIEGTMVDAEHQPVPGARVWLTADCGMVEVITDRRGRYRFNGVPPGTVWLRRLLREEDPRDTPVGPIEVEAGKTQTIELELPKPR